MNEYTYRLYVIISLVAIVLSILGSIFNIITTIYLKKSDIIISKMVIYLSLADLAASIATVLVLELLISSEFTCQSVTFVMYFAFGSSLSLTCCFAHSLYAITKFDIQNLVNYLKFYQIISMAVGSIIGALSLIIKVNGIRENKCIFIVTEGRFDLGSLVVTIPSAISIIYCGISYILVIRQLRELGTRTHAELLLYPAILILCYLPYLFLTWNSEPVFWLSYIGGALGNSQGLFNALAYGLSKKIVDGYRNKCCRRRNDESQSEQEESIEVSQSSDYRSF